MRRSYPAGRSRKSVLSGAGRGIMLRITWIGGIRWTRSCIGLIRPNRSAPKVEPGPDPETREMDDTGERL
ncbi:hypothetical protein Amme_049_010 [Acidomonas methanolica NBRC 104435]|uniref:Uncharacterized protein n=1 Tax=Acidomonas methanolica NBRC 104435 TaxID=1231351 RepID=A0A023D5T9_ACIMT|nr:hypothetical protein Amme_049_010 [Acidomonas methanolica NBRC 104435]GEL00530.1 hypothetical protein AME01nite_30280 [Acidomonas methanolica NBRC 104435]